MGDGRLSVCQHGADHISRGPHIYPLSGQGVFGRNSLSLPLLMGLVSGRILPLTLFLNIFLNVAFLIYSGTLPPPHFLSLAPNQLTPHNAQTKTHARPAWTAQLAQYPIEPISFAMVMYGESSAKEGLLALKTTLMHISRPAEFHIICSPDAIPVIQSKLNLFSR